MEVDPLNRTAIYNAVKDLEPEQKLIALRDPWIFLSTCVFSSDERDKEQSIKPAPTEKAYIKQLVDLWTAHDLSVLVKSRQMWCSWLYASLYLHDCLAHTNRQNFFVSEKQEKADALIERMKFIYYRIPAEIWPPMLLPKMRRVQNHAYFEDVDSALHALPSGKDQMRGYTASGILDDELAFWDDAEETLSAQKPAAQKVTIISTIPETISTDPTFYWKLVYDQIDNNKGPDIKDVRTHMKGMRSWLCGNSGFTTTELHFTADPEKDTPEYVEWSQSGMPYKKWEREYNLKWTQSAGSPVYGEEFSPDLHGIAEYGPDIRFPIVRAWDKGTKALAQVCVFGQMIDNVLYIFDEVIAQNHFPGETHVGMKRFARYIRDYSIKYYQNYEFEDVADPSINAQESNDKNARYYMRENGIYPKNGEVSFGTRRDAVIELLQKMERGKACLRVVKKRCPVTFTGFIGGYQFPEKISERSVQRPDRPLKNAYSHVHDCVQYLACYYRLQNKALRNRFEYINIPIEEYGF
jgi:hypothetical protein